MHLDRVIAVLAPEEVVAAAPVEIADLAYDARRVVPGALFFCVPGGRADGHDFAPDAVARGAAALVVERRLDVALPQLIVRDARAAMAPVAAEFFGHPSHELPVVAVTGTNGKTTTAFLLHAILTEAGLEPGLLGNIERRVGAESRAASLNTPEAIDLQRTLREMVDAGNRSCALEASSHASVQHRLDGTRFATLAFTNLSRDHLDFHGSIERYFDAKRRLFLMGDRPPAAVAIGDQWGQRLADELRLRGDAPVVTFSLDREADARAEDVEELPDGIRLRVGDLPLRTRLRGRFNLWNVLAAVTSARLLGVADDAIASGVARLDGVPGRLEPVDEGQPFTVLVDYAHTPDSLATALGAARSLATGRVISVFGCGGDRDPGKRPAMGEVSSRLADVTVVTSDNPRSEDPEAIVAEILAGVTGDVTVELDRRAAITRAIESAHPGDVVVVAGRGHEREQEIAGALYPLDDRQVAREALRALLAAA